MKNNDSAVLPPDLIRTLVASDQLLDRRQHVAGLQVGLEQDVELFSLQDVHLDPLFQNGTQEPLHQRQHSEGGREQSNSSMELENELEAQQTGPDTQVFISRPDPGNDREIAGIREEEGQAAIVHRPPSSPAVDNDAMETDNESDDEIRSFCRDQEANLSDKYPIVSSPGSSHSSRHSTPAFEAKPDQKCCSQLERAVFERIEQSICLSEEVVLIKSLDNDVCRAEERDILNSLEGRIANKERQSQKLQNREKRNTIFKAGSKIPRLLSESREQFITSEFLTEFTNSFEHQHMCNKKETTFRTYLVEIARMPQTWKLCVEGPEETVRLFFAHWGKHIRKHVLRYNFTKLRHDGIELVLRLDVTQRLGVRIENADNQPGLFVLKRGDVFEGQLADIVSPENLSAGAVILSVDGLVCSTVTALCNRIEEARKAGTKYIQIKLCLARSINLGLIDHTAVVSLPVYRSNRETIPLPLVKSNRQIVSRMDQRRAPSEDSKRRERSPNCAGMQSQKEHTYNAESRLSTVPDRCSKKRKDPNARTDDLPKRVRNDQYMDNQIDAPFVYTSLLRDEPSKRKMNPANGGGGPNTYETGSQSRTHARNDQRWDRQIGGNDQRNMKPVNQNGGLNDCVPRKGIVNTNDASILKWPPSRNRESEEANILSSREEVAVGNKSLGIPASNSRTSRVGWPTLKKAPSGPLRIGDFSKPPQVEAHTATADKQAVVNTSQRDGDAAIQRTKVFDTARYEPAPLMESAIFDSGAEAHIDTDHQETFATKFDSVLPLGFYCIYDRTTRSCRVVSVCPTGQASKDERIQPGTKLIGINIEQMQHDRTFVIKNGVNAHVTVSQNNLTLESHATEKRMDENADSYKDEVDERSGVRHIWGPRDLKKHLLAARTKGLSVEVWLANDSDNPYFISFRGRFREAQWGDEGEWKGPSFAGWDGVLQPEAFIAKEKSVVAPVASRKVQFSGKDLTRRFFRDESLTSECTFIPNSEDNLRRKGNHVFAANSHFKSLKDAISRGTVYDLIEYIHPANTQGIDDTRRNEKKEELSIKVFAEARSMTKQNECTDPDRKDKLLKICARTLRAINLARAFRFWEKFDVHVVAIRNLQLPHSIKHHSCSVYLEADQVSPTDTTVLPTSQTCPWNPRFIEIPDLTYPVSFNKHVETNRKTVIHVMARPANSDTATCVGTVEITESNLSTFKADSEFNDYRRTASTIIGESFYVDFRVSRTPTPDERRKKVEALKYIREGVYSIQAFNRDLDESRGVKLSVDMHFSTEKHFTLLHAAIALYDVPTFQKVLLAGANPFLKTPFGSPFAMAQQKVEHLAGANGELQHRRKSQIEEMIVLMRELDTTQTVYQPLANQDVLHVGEVEPEVEHIPEPLLTDSDSPSALRVEAFESEVEHIPEPLLQDNDSLSTRDPMSVPEEASTDPVTPILRHPYWLDVRLRNPQFCTDFEASQSCPRHDRCRFIHRYRSYREQLPHILEKSQDHPLPDHDADCFDILMETSSTGQVWFTSGYSSCMKHDKKQIFYAEGGQNGVPSSQNVWWYPTEAEAMLAIHRVMAACDWAATRGNDAILHHRKTLVDMGLLADTWTNLSKRRKGHCKFWPRCRKSDQDCTFFHGYGPFDDPGSRAKKKKKQSDQRSSANDTSYDIRCVARKDLKEGRWYHTARYRHPDDDGLHYVHNYHNEGFYDNRNEILWFESEEKVRAAIALNK